MAAPATARPVPDAPRARAARPPRARVWRTLLVSGGLVATAVAASTGASEARAAVDPELVRLLRGMALIKAVLTLAALAAVLWRLGRPISAGLCGTYLAGSWAMAAATVLIWQLVLLPAAALAFHAGEIALLLAAWRDGGLRVRATAHPASSEPTETQ